MQIAVACAYGDAADVHANLFALVAIMVRHGDRATGRWYGGGLGPWAPGPRDGGWGVVDKRLGFGVKGLHDTQQVATRASKHMCYTPAPSPPSSYTPAPTTTLTNCATPPPTPLTNCATHISDNYKQDI
jgi:hypothetical protein